MKFAIGDADSLQQNEVEEGRPKRILVIEQRHSGHLLVYVREIVIEIQNAGHIAVIAVGDSVPSTAEYAQTLADLDVTVLTFRGDLTPQVSSDLSRRSQADAVIVPHGDELAVRVGSKLSVPEVPTVLLIMRDPRWEWRLGGPARWPKLIGKCVLISLASLKMRTKIVWLRSYGYKGRLSHVIDPFIPDGSWESIASSGRALRKTLDMSEDTFWFVVTGAITDRKNVPMIARALSQAQLRVPGKRLGLALIGPQRTSQPFDANNFLGDAAHSLKVVVENRILTNFEMNAAVKAGDAVIMAYSSHSPNSTMLKSFALGSRIVVSGPHSVRRFAQQMGLEMIVPLEISELVKAIVETTESRAPSPVTSVPTGRDFAVTLVSMALGRTIA